MDAVPRTFFKSLHDLNVLHSLDKIVTLVRISHVFEDSLHVFRAVEVGDRTIVEDVVDIFYKGLVDNLCIGHQEYMGVTFNTGSGEDVVNHVFTPILHAVALDDLKLDHLVLSDERSEF